MRARFRALSIAALMAFGLGCTPANLDSAATETAPPVTGSLYIAHPSQSGGRPEVSIVRDGKVLPHPAPSGVLVARDRPAITFSTAPLLPHARDRRACEPVAISPHGIYGACLRNDGKGTVAIFRLADPSGTQHSGRAQVTVNALHMLGFTSDRELAVAADDETCPSFARNDAVYSFEPRARLWVLAPDGHVLRKGPCVHGLVAGEKKIAFTFHDNKDRPLYSLDGSVWQPGLAVTFAGGDHLLIINKWDQLVDEDGKVIANDVVDAFWTR